MFVRMGGWLGEKETSVQVGEANLLALGSFLFREGGDLPFLSFILYLGI